MNIKERELTWEFSLDVRPTKLLFLANLFLDDFMSLLFFLINFFFKVKPDLLFLLMLAQGKSNMLRMVQLQILIFTIRFR